MMVVFDFFSQLWGRRLFSRAYPVPGAFTPRAHIHAGYLSLFRLLKLLGVHEVIEIGPGYSSVPALALRTSLGRRMQYLGVDKNPDAAADLEAYLKAVGLREKIMVGSVLDEPFMWEILEGRARSALCFEHALEDVLFDLVRSSQSSLMRNLPSEPDEELEALLATLSEDYLEYEMRRVADTLQWIGSTFDVLLVIHHYTSPWYLEGSRAQKVDLMIGSFVRDFVDRNGRTIPSDMLPKRFPAEYWWVGAFT